MLPNSSSKAETQAGDQRIPKLLWKRHFIIVLISKYKCLSIILIWWLLGGKKVPHKDWEIFISKKFLLLESCCLIILNVDKTPSVYQFLWLQVLSLTLEIKNYFEKISKLNLHKNILNW